MTCRRALIVGIGGQDGSYLAEFLLGCGYDVYGIVRPTSVPVPERVAHVVDRIGLLRLDVHDAPSLMNALDAVQPDEIYNLAGDSFVPDSWSRPAQTVENTGLVALGLLEAIRLTNPRIRFYQASSSEMFGRPDCAPQNENTSFDPRNPYAFAKLHGHLLVQLYRSCYGLFAASGILYNHESPRRPVHFVTRKICRGAAAIALGQSSKLHLGDISAQRDWGFAGDFVYAMWLTLQRDDPRDYVIAAGGLHSVRELLDLAFGHAGLSWDDHVVVDLSLVRPDDGRPQLVGDATRARLELGWTPSVKFGELVRLMVDADLERLASRGRPSAELDWPAGMSPLSAENRRRLPVDEAAEFGDGAEWTIVPPRP